MDPTEYAKQMRRHRYAIMSIAVALIIAALIIVFKCQILGHFGLPGCCCQGAHADAMTHRTSALAALPSTLVAGSATRISTDLTWPSNSVFTPGGALNSGHPFGASRRTLLASATSEIPPSSPLSAAPSAFQIVPDTGTGDGGNTYVDTWLPPDDGLACQGVCYQIDGTTPTPPVGPPSAVPESASWLDMICGFAVLGCALRLRSALA